MKSHKKELLLSSILILLPMVAGILLWNRLPETMATHFDMNNEANGWSSKFFAVVGLPLLLLGLHFLMVWGTLQDPKKSNIGKSMFSVILWIVPVISVVANGSIILIGLGKSVDTGLTTGILVGIMFVIIGNYLSKNQQNYTVGIRLPWTLNSEENWVKTHRMASKLWMVAGFVMIINAFLQIKLVMQVVLIMAAVVPMIYSFLLYKKEEK